MPKPIILCVDDEKIILESIKRQLKDEFGQTYQYQFADNAEDAMELLEELEDDNEEILVIVSDWLMPGKKGDEFLIEVHKHHPKMVKIMLTGQADNDAIERAKTQANLHCCLSKHWNDEELVKTIKSGLKKLV